MNHKQKLGYIALGASIMLIGMWIGNSTSPPLIAQSNGELTCKQLTFVSETGLPLFTLQAEQTQDKDSSLYIRNRVGKKTMELRTSIVGNSVFVYDRDEVAKVLLHGFKYGSGVIYTKDDDGFTASMTNDFSVYNTDGKITASMTNFENGGSVYVRNTDGNVTVGMSTGKHGGNIEVYDNDGNKSVSVDTTALGGNIILANRNDKPSASVELRVDKYRPSP